MIKIENIEVFNTTRAIYASRNAMNSWDKSDSDLKNDLVGDNDLDLAQRLYKAGSDHRKYMRMITVTMDITAPLYWWKEFDTYKVGTVANSCSTMHKIHAKEFTIDDFSHEHLLQSSSIEDQKHTCHESPCQCEQSGIAIFDYHDTLRLVCIALNSARDRYLKTKDKKYWWQMIQLLPSSYNQKRTILLNLEVIDNMVKNRKHHRLDEWQELVKEFENIEIYKMITGREK